MLKYDSVRELTEAARAAGCRISDVVLADQAESMETDADVLYSRMAEDYRIMREAVKEGSVKKLKSTSGLTGGDAYKMKKAAEKGSAMCGGLLRMQLPKHFPYQS